MKNVTIPYYGIQYPIIPHSNWVWFPTYLRTVSHLHTCHIWLCLGCSLHFQCFSYLARNASLHVNLPDMIQAIWLPNGPKPLGGFQWLANCYQVSNLCCRVKASQCKHMPSVTPFVTHHQFKMVVNSNLVQKTLLNEFNQGGWRWGCVSQCLYSHCTYVPTTIRWHSLSDDIVYPTFTMEHIP